MTLSGMDKTSTIRVFISYAWDDTLLADTIADALLEVKGIEVDRDNRKSSLGTPLSERLQGQIKECDVFLLLLTQANVESKWVTAELSWANQLEKRVIPVVQRGTHLSDIPGGTLALEYLEFDPSNYRELIKKLVASICAIHDVTLEADMESPRTAVQNDNDDLMELLPRDLENLLSLSSDAVARQLEPQLIEAARLAVHRFFTNPKHFYANIGTLQTDGQTLIIRWDTLHALLRAASKPQARAYRIAGYEAGVLYGIGVISWFLRKCQEAHGRAGLPRTTYDLLWACAAIDKASGWGDIKLNRHDAEMPSIGWTGEIRIQNDFLTSYHQAFESTEEALYRNFRSFWQGYLEGTFSTALGTWYGIKTSDGRGAEIPLLYAICSPAENENSDGLLFKLEVRQPHYGATFLNLQRELFCPYLRDESTRIVARARTVVEGFVRELAGVEGSPQEHVQKALTWLAQHGPTSMRGAASVMQNARNKLHAGVHEGNSEPSKEEAHKVVRTTSAAVLLACREILLSSEERKEFARQLILED